MFELSSTQRSQAEERKERETQKGPTDGMEGEGETWWVDRMKLDKFRNSSCSDQRLHHNLLNHIEQDSES